MIRLELDIKNESIKENGKRKNSGRNGVTPSSENLEKKKITYNNEN